MLKKSGYLYVLVHPSDPDLYKIGVTILQPAKRLAKHNSQHEKYAGRIVKETGQKWQIKTYIEVSDPYFAERAFWRVTPYADIPYRNGIEIVKMSWDEVQKGLEAAKIAGFRPESKTMPDHVYAYTASIRHRLEGRGITLLSYVRSVVSGKANFRCDNRHEWRTRPLLVGEGQGCPVCGMGECSSDEINRKIKAGVICLLTHPRKLGFVNIGLGYGTLEEVCKDRPWGEWEVHRYRNIEEVALAKSLMWELLGKPLPHSGEPIQIDLNEAEDAFRKLIYVMRAEIALIEKAKEAAQKISR